jgi:hypothetical protein
MRVDELDAGQRAGEGHVAREVEGAEAVVGHDGTARGDEDESRNGKKYSHGG